MTRVMNQCGCFVNSVYFVINLFDSRENECLWRNLTKPGKTRNEIYIGSYDEFGSNL